MKIAIGNDHTATRLKQIVSEYLKGLGYDIIDYGAYDGFRSHYPIYGKKVGEAVVTHKADFGVILCGTGLGVGAAANKVPGVRACVARDWQTAEYARRELNANIVTFGKHIVGEDVACTIAQKFIETKYEGQNPDLVKAIDDQLTEVDPAQWKDDFWDEFLVKWRAGYYHD